MPQKLNKAGKMQDYIPAGNGDPSGEYGTSKGTNKNFTTSDKKSSKANVITENKSVVVGDKKNISFSDGKNNKLNAKVIDKSDLSKYDKQRKEGEVEIDGEKYDIYSYENGDRTWGAEYGNVAVKKEKAKTSYVDDENREKTNKEMIHDINKREWYEVKKSEKFDGKYDLIDSQGKTRTVDEKMLEDIKKSSPLNNNNKANVINDDLSGNVDKEGYINKEIAELLGQNEKQVKDQIHRLHFMSGGDKMETAKTYYEMALQSKYGLPKYREIVEDKHNKEWYEKADDNYAKAEQHLHSKSKDYENIPEIKAIYEKMGKDILRERKLIYDKLKEFDK